eukprot:CAMPEP_0202871724 /NCGR_PEP_ID=MMETSP1391-20130828/19508_1 /ASSEMBLY_ACC=CAM_ASM_000867 /TAXON_ID=1034604 /ORGANISM="Chlamydomonas leiostraca, Strain SAG 11-49" /LENGTH=36 /DNA_ID= /DNA_START= /DNA_END= /DNA_ORIENTATION=
MSDTQKRNSSTASVTVTAQLRGGAPGWRADTRLRSM